MQDERTFTFVHPRSWLDQWLGQATGGLLLLSLVFYAAAGRVEPPEAPEPALLSCAATPEACEALRPAWAADLPSREAYLGHRLHKTANGVDLEHPVALLEAMVDIRLELMGMPTPRFSTEQLEDLAGQELFPAPTLHPRARETLERLVAPQVEAYVLAVEHQERAWDAQAEDDAAWHRMRWQQQLERHEQALFLQQAGLLWMGLLALVLGAYLITRRSWRNRDVYLTRHVVRFGDDERLFEDMTENEASEIVRWAVQGGRRGQASPLRDALLERIEAGRRTTGVDGQRLTLETLLNRT